MHTPRETSTLVHTGIDSVFEQFFERRGWPLHHLSCGNLVHDLLGKRLDAPLASRLRRLLARGHSCGEAAVRMPQLADASAGAIQVADQPTPTPS